MKKQAHCFSVMCVSVCESVVSGRLCGRGRRMSQKDEWMTELIRLMLCTSHMMQNVLYQIRNAACDLVLHQIQICCIMKRKNLADIKNVMIKLSLFL